MLHRKQNCKVVDSTLFFAFFEHLPKIHVKICQFVHSLQMQEMSLFLSQAVILKAALLILSTPVLITFFVQSVVELFPLLSLECIFLFSFCPLSSDDKSSPYHLFFSL